MKSRPSLATLVIVVSLAFAEGALAAPSEDKIMPPDQYSTEKARRLGITYQKALRDLNAGIYHCLPWLEAARGSIGFFRPKGATQDDRYLSLRVYIEQDPSPQFSALRTEGRASAMFSRYVGPMLRRMTADPAVVNDPALDGFLVTLEWQKQAGSRAANPVHESIAIWMKKPEVADYLAGRTPITEVAARAQILGWDGETALGSLQLAVWDDSFVSTYKVANYQLEPGASCP
ncbi:MAG: hypothetical protein HY216_15380 [Candidatus Rokubacteria bacterium]|nr:hypothetical protein [Candidatus Rokubacteria bacterium]